MLSSLFIRGADVSGGSDDDWFWAEHSRHMFNDYEAQVEVPNQLISYPSCPAKLPSALTSLDICCPSLRSLSLMRCPGVQSLTIEQRSPIPSLAAADDKVFETAMASVLEEVEIMHCDGLSQLVLKATAASSANVSSPRISSPPKKLKTTTFTMTAHPPRRSAIVEWNVEECGRLRTVEVDDGWMLGPKTKRSLTYFALEHRDVKVSAKGIGDDKAMKK